MPRVLPGLLDDHSEREILLAIGSVLFDHHPAGIKKIVLGSGYGGYTALPTLDENWDVRCVRGPLTAHVLGLSSDKVAGDTAILLRNYYQPSTDKAVNVSFVPHFESISRGHWQTACDRCGIRFIDPRLPVDMVLKQLSESKLVVTEAMHGAIVSDCLRVPWVAMKPIDSKHHMKWADWAGALNFEVRFQSVYPSSIRELYFSRRGHEWMKLKNSGGLWPQAAKYADIILTEVAAQTLSRAAKAEPQLSSDRAIANATEKLQLAVESIQRDYNAIS